MGDGGQKTCGRDGSSTARPESQPLTSEGKQRAGELPHTPHTRVVLRGTQNQPSRVKIRAKGIGWRSRRVGESVIVFVFIGERVSVGLRASSTKIKKSEWVIPVIHSIKNIAQ